MIKICLKGKKLNWFKIIGDSVLLGTCIVIFAIYLYLSLKFLQTGEIYTVRIVTNKYGEHFPELFMFIIGIYFFIKNIKLENYIYD